MSFVNRSTPAWPPSMAIALKQKNNCLLKYHVFQMIIPQCFVEFKPASVSNRVNWINTSFLLDASFKLMPKQFIRMSTFGDQKIPKSSFLKGSFHTSIDFSILKVKIHRTKLIRRQQMFKKSKFLLIFMSGVTNNTKLRFLWITSFVAGGLVAQVSLRAKQTEWPVPNTPSFLVLSLFYFRRS